MNGLLYILIFGIGSMLGMFTISVLLALAGERINSAIRPIQMSTGILSCAFGVYLAASICLNVLRQTMSGNRKISGTPRGVLAGNQRPT